MVFPIVYQESTKPQSSEENRKLLSSLDVDQVITLATIVCNFLSYHNEEVHNECHFRSPCCKLML